MGTAMAYSFTGLLRRVTPKYQIFLKIFKRACILFVLGLLINTEGCEGKDILYVHKHIQKKKIEPTVDQSWSEFYRLKLDLYHIVLMKSR